jgi:hypothetical protein
VSYTKLFSSIIHSTIWREDNPTRLVWITMLAIADFDGRVEASVPGLADAARVDIAACEAALERLSQPDFYSRSQEYEGRRIAAIDGGWMILNHGKYRDKKASRRDYYKSWRANQTSENLTIAQHSAQQCSTHTETETETDTDNNNITQKTFEIARKLYPGLKRGFSTEYGNFIKRHKDWKQVVSLLEPAITREVEHKKQLKASSAFCPEWKHFQTWINQRCWEQEFGAVHPASEQDKPRLRPISGKVCGKCGMPAVWRSRGEYDNYYCAEHLPQKIKEKYRG